MAVLKGGRMDLFDKCRQYTTVRSAIEAGTYPYFTVLEGHEGTIASFQGRKVIMCGSNNYLGLTMDPRVRKASRQALEEFGPSCTGSRFLNGNLQLHELLERELRACTSRVGKLVIVDGVYAMGGDIAPLPEIVRVCREYEARLLVDDA